MRDDEKVSRFPPRGDGFDGEPVRITRESDSSIGLMAVLLLVMTLAFCAAGVRACADAQMMPDMSANHLK